MVQKVIRGIKLSVALNKLTSEVIQPFLFEEDSKVKKVIGIYTGRFQPMGKHHVDTFKWIEKQFGPKNTFVVTSNATNSTNSPFNFKEKLAIINKHNIKNNC